jgi:hypothetical protein
MFDAHARDLHETIGRLLRQRGPTALAVLVLAAISWPFPSIVPGVVADWNWVAALALIAEHGIRFGNEIAWTYGPLGFLDNVFGLSLYFGDLGALEFLYQGLVQLLLAGTLFVALRRSLWAPIAFVVSAVVISVVPDRTFALGAAWCVLALTRDDRPRDRLAAAFPAAIGTLAGVMVLVKLNQGIGLLALATVALATRSCRRPRDWGAFAAALLATAAVGWFATNQTIGDVWPFLRNGKELVSGYAAAMGLLSPTLEWTQWAAALIVALALALTIEAARGADPRRRAGLLAVWALYSFLDFKEGFVRNDTGHVLLFFADMVVLLAILPVRQSRRALLLASVATCVVLMTGANGTYDLGRALDPSHHLRSAVDQTRFLAHHEQRAGIEALTRQRIAALYAVPAPVLAGIGTRTVAFWPHVYGDLAFAYSLNWRPLPVLEAYSAYTPALDALGADMLASARAPARIVRSTEGPIDGRYAGFDAPRTWLEILCRYRPLVDTPGWQLLGRGPDRCGAPRTLATTTAAWGQHVAVPAPRTRDALVLAKIDGAGPRGLERLRALWLRPNLRSVTLDHTAYRLLTETATDGLLLSAPRGSDYAPPFALAPNPAQISIDRHGGEPHGTLRYTFVEVPIRPLPAQKGAR